MNKPVLVVDDEESICNTFARTIERTGHAVTCARSGDEALRQFQTDAFSLVFLDLNMPGISGVDTLIEMRKRDPDVPIYICTGFLEKYVESLRALQEKGVIFDVLVKPVGGQQLKDLVTGCLGGPDVSTVTA